MTMATAGQGGICFACGQPLPRDLAAEPPPAAAANAAQFAPLRGAGPPAAEPLAAFPLTGALPSALEPPPNPYAGSATAASIIGAAGEFAIRAGVEVKVGRDPAQCPIMLSEPRVSGVHATLRFEGGQLMVRDEGSNNGTYVNGSRIAANVFTPVMAGGTLKFGPVEFSVRLS